MTLLSVTTTERLVPQSRVPTRARFSPRRPPRRPMIIETTPRVNPTQPRRNENGYHQNTTRLKNPRLTDATAIPRVGAVCRLPGGLAVGGGVGSMSTFPSVG